MKTSPLIEQYLRLKDENKDAILFFRLGDFYEMFMDDAVEVSALLNLTLTKRVDNPMCGIPYHAASVYIKRLLDFGKKIAICEQVGVPKGTLMERKVVRLITPGTIVDEDFLDEGSPNYILSFYSSNGVFYTCRGDISTGRFIVRSFDNFESLFSFINFCQIKEIVVCDDDYFSSREHRATLDSSGIIINKYPHTSFTVRFGINIFKEILKTSTISFSELDSASLFWGAIGGLLDYFKVLHITDALHISSVVKESEKGYVTLDESALRSLEVIKTSNGKSTTVSLFGVLNFTCTAMGQRLLKERLMAPLRDVNEIEKRLSWCDYFKNNNNERKRLRKLLTSVYDIERMSVYIMNGDVKKYQLLRLNKTLKAVNLILENTFDTYKTLFKNIDRVKYDEVISIGNEIENSLDDDVTSKKLIKDNVNSELDRIREFRNKGESIINDYIQSLKEETGITNLKLGNSKVFGFTIDVTPSMVKKVPDDWQEVQTLVTSRRYITPKLKELEKEKERSEFEEGKIENAIYNALAFKVISKAIDILNIAEGIKELDFLEALAEAAATYNYTRPKFTTTGEIVIKNGRHPIVERFSEKGKFTPNSIDINTNDKSFMLITGPNMAGKSTYLRQNALIIIMAQLGSFVSADEALITPVDRIYSRLGFNDNIASGESTFFVEMKETALILRSATKDSFVILDEIGRGTGADDGEAIAESVMRFLAKKRIKTLFATHYLSIASHNVESNVIKMTLEVDERDGNVRFLRRMINGVASSSYGLHVAAIAGVPESVLFIAKENLKKIQNDKSSDNATNNTFYNHGLFDDIPSVTERTETLMKYDTLKRMIDNFDVDSSTPLNALTFVGELKKEVKSFDDN